MLPTLRASRRTLSLTTSGNSALRRTVTGSRGPLLCAGESKCRCSAATRSPQSRCACEPGTTCTSARETAQ